jgi:hypothetical protein
MATKVQRIKKSDKQNFINFVQSDEVQKTLKSIPKHLQQRYLREGFTNQTGIQMSPHTYYKLMKAIDNQQSLGGKSFAII